MRNKNIKPTIEQRLELLEDSVRLLYKKLGEIPQWIHQIITDRKGEENANSFMERSKR